MQGTNRLLQMLSTPMRDKVLAGARSVLLPRGYLLTRSSEAAHEVYFLTRGMASFVVSLKEGELTEIGVVGNEGMVGNANLLGTYAPIASCIMQIQGEGFRLPLADVKRLFDESAELRHLVLQATQQQLLTISQNAACNRLHKATERLARWLLTAADRTEADVVPLTQEAVAQMLGTRRTTVALVAGSLQRSGYVQYQRGSVRIVDRAGLTAAACDCYRITGAMVDCLYSALPPRR